MAESYIIKANSSALFTATLVDENGNPLSNNVLTSLTLTLTAVLPRNSNPTTIINSRNAQNVLNQNGVTVDAKGKIAWNMTPEDNVIVSQGTVESHSATFVWTWGSPLKRGRHTITFKVTA